MSFSHHRNRLRRLDGRIIDRSAVEIERLQKVVYILLIRAIIGPLRKGREPEPRIVEVDRVAESIMPGWRRALFSDEPVNSSEDFTVDTNRRPRLHQLARRVAERMRDEGKVDLIRYRILVPPRPTRSSPPTN